MILRSCGSRIRLKRTLPLPRCKRMSNGNPARIQTIYSGRTLSERGGDRLKNARTPDIIVQPIRHNHTHRTAKVAEHGGFTDDDTHVAMLVVDGTEQHPQARAISATVPTTQVAPSILKFLGLDPRALESVRLEHTQALLGLGD